MNPPTIIRRAPISVNVRLAAAREAASQPAPAPAPARAELSALSVADACHRVACAAWERELNVCAITGVPGEPASFKAPGYRWESDHHERQTLARMWQFNKLWEVATGVGLVHAIGGLVAIELDWHKASDGGKMPGCVPESIVDLVLGHLDLDERYPWVSLSGSRSGWAIWVRCLDTDALPAEHWPRHAKTGRLSGVYTTHPRPAFAAAFAHAELRLAGSQTLIPPSLHASGGRYTWRDGSLELPATELALVPAERVECALRSLCHSPAEHAEMERAKRAAARGQQTRQPRPAPACQQRQGDQDDTDALALLERCVARLDWAALISALLPDSKIQHERDGQIRVLGNCGLLIDPEAGVWHHFGSGAGGGPLQLVAWSLSGQIEWQPRGRDFWRCLRELCRICGVDCPPPPEARPAWADTGLRGLRRPASRQDALAPASRPARATRLTVPRRLV